MLAIAQYLIISNKSPYLQRLTSTAIPIIAKIQPKMRHPILLLSSARTETAAQQINNIKIHKKHTTISSKEI